MKTFFNIFQKIMNVNVHVYPDEPFTIFPTNVLKPEYHLINYFIKLMYYQEKQSTKKCKIYRTAESKFSVLRFFILSSFCNDDLKDKIFNIFSLSQKTYFALIKCKRLWMHKKYPIVVTTDLSLNPLDETNKNTFVLLQHKSKYLFRVNDLISIIETSIGNSPEFFADPLSPKNPYNNQIFDNSTLYNIYFKMKYSDRILSSLFHGFFLENFIKHNFFITHEPLIRQTAIKDYVFKSPYTSCYSLVIEMIQSNKYTKLLHIDSQFPKDVLVDIFRPFLYYFCVIRYDIRGTEKIHKYRGILEYKLFMFYKFNRAFGRKYVKIIKINGKMIKQEYLFNTKHVTFYQIPSIYKMLEVPSDIMYNLQTINNDVNNVNVNVNNNNIILSYNIGNVNDNLFNSYLEIITVEEYTTPIYDDTDDFEEDDTDDDTDDDSIS
jgi:hypothetical protein